MRCSIITFPLFRHQLKIAGIEGIVRDESLRRKASLRKLIKEIVSSIDSWEVEELIDQLDNPNSKLGKKLGDMREEIATYAFKQYIKTQNLRELEWMLEEEEIQEEEIQEKEIYDRKRRQIIRNRIKYLRRKEKNKRMVFQKTYSK